MSVQTELMDERTSVPAAKTYPAISPLRVVAWSVRRELWDNRSLYLAPAIVAALVLLGFFVGPFGLRHPMVFSTAVQQGGPDAGSARMMLEGPYQLLTGALLVTALLVSVFYAVDCLFTERRDRSVLFWKSLPVSDTETVLAKASVPLVVVPAITFAMTVLTHVVMVVANIVALKSSGSPVAPLWAGLQLPQMWLQLLGQMCVTSLWYAPFYGWLLLVSAGVTRAPLLWALLPPLALALLESMEFHTTRLWQALAGRVAHGGLFPQNFPQEALQGSLRDVSMWGGLAVTVVFLAGAVQLRRSRSML